MIPLFINQRFVRCIEIFFVLAVLVCAGHLVHERILARSLPSGDEGSWMSVAAEVSRGHGFTTTWLEHPFLLPYSLPRPDDYRYPGLTMALAAGFKMFGISYSTALKTAEAVFLVFLMALYLTTRRFFGVRVAFCTIIVTSFSLLQLYWSSQIYAESLFGISIAIILLLSKRYNFQTLGWWLAVGTAIGLSYLVRPNAILFFTGICVVFIWQKKQHNLSWKHPGAAVLGFAVIAAPYFIRNYFAFGNPFHIAGSAGLLRTTASEPLTYSFLQFLHIYGIGYFIKAIALGCINFFTCLHFFEHGLEAIPLTLAVCGVIFRKQCYSLFFVVSSIVTFFFCCYISYRDNWAGVRYFSSFLPFIYAYGFYVAISTIDRLIHRQSFIKKGALTLGLIVLVLLSVVYPHRYYERIYSKTSDVDKTFTNHTRIMQSHMGPSGCYMARSMAQVNFLMDYSCVGMQGFFDSTEAVRAVRVFKPSLMVLTTNELNDPVIISALKGLRSINISPDIVGQDGEVWYFSLR